MRQCFRFLKNQISADRVRQTLQGPILISEKNYEDLDPNTIQEKSGIYFIVSKQHKFVYPKGDSPLIYIGKADNLRRRIQDHLVAYKNANPKAMWTYSRYNYMDMSGGFEIYYLTTITNEKAKYLESRAMEDFYDRYLATPVGNGAFSYR